MSVPLLHGVSHTWNGLSRLRTISDKIFSLWVMFRKNNQDVADTTKRIMSRDKSNLSLVITYKGKLIYKVQAYVHLSDFPANTPKIPTYFFKQKLGGGGDRGFFFILFIHRLKTNIWALSPWKIPPLKYKRMSTPRTVDSCDAWMFKASCLNKFFHDKISRKNPTILYSWKLLNIYIYSIKWPLKILMKKIIYIFTYKSCFPS